MIFISKNGKSLKLKVHDFAGQEPLTDDSF